MADEELQEVWADILPPRRLAKVSAVVFGHIWMGLLDSDGHEPVTREYNRLPIRVAPGGVPLSAVFRVQHSVIVVAVGLFLTEVGDNLLMRSNLDGHIVLGPDFTFTPNLRLQDLEGKEWLAMLKEKGVL